MNPRPRRCERRALPAELHPQAALRKLRLLFIGETRVSPSDGRVIGLLRFLKLLQHPPCQPLPDFGIITVYINKDYLFLPDIFMVEAELLVVRLTSL